MLARSTTTPNLATDFIHLLIADDNDKRSMVVSRSTQGLSWNGGRWLRLAPC